MKSNSDHLNDDVVLDVSLYWFSITITLVLSAIPTFFFNFVILFILVINNICVSFECSIIIMY